MKIILFNKMSFACKLDVTESCQPIILLPIPVYKLCTPAAYILSQDTTHCRILSHKMFKIKQNKNAALIFIEFLVC